VLFHRLMRRLSWALLGVFFRLRVTGREHVPDKGALVVVANHESFLDPFIVGVSLIKRPPLTFLAAPWVFSTPLVGGFSRRVGAIPAYGEGKEVTALRGSIRVLEQGKSVALFPQGGINREGISGGAVFMAIKARVPILALRISGAGKALPLKRWWPSLFTRIAVEIQPLIRSEELQPPGVSTSVAVDRGVERLAGLLVPTRGKSSGDGRP
jgi:1-acyl-sn-glycerol-3-phosphate acyltransferase